MTHYYWLSFSRAAREGEHGNLGAIIISTSDRKEFDEIIALATARGLVPRETISYAGGEMSEEDVRDYPIDTFMTREELVNRDDVGSVRSELPLCDDCIEELKT